MALVRAMNSAISGLRSQQFKIDTIGDNLANSTTTGFKTGRVEFKTLLSQTISFGTAPQGFLGGVDPIQQGLGVAVASTTRNFSQGELETTGVATDLAVDGNGFFILQNGQGGLAYSRDGGFTINPANLLHDPGTGFVVQGVTADLSTFTIASGAPIGSISIPVGNLQIAAATQNAEFDGNLDGGGEQALMGTTLQSAGLVDNFGGFTPATSATLLSNISRATATGFVDLALDSGDTITVNAVKGGRTLPAQKFFVGSSLPVGFDGFGTTLGEFASFMQRALGINTGPSLQYGAVRDNDTNPNTPGSSFAATTVTSTSVRVAGANFGVGGENIQVGDILRFNSGAGAGQIARITSISSTVTPNDTLNFTAPLSSGLSLPVAGDQFTIHEPAGVSISGAATPWLTNGALHVSGNVGLANAITNLQISNTTDNINVSPFTQLDAASGESILANASFFDSQGNSHLAEFTFVLETKGGVDLVTGSVGNTWRVFSEGADSKLLGAGGAIAGSNRVIGDGQITFSNAGQFLSQQPSSASGFVSLAIPNQGAMTPLNVLPDFAGMTGFASNVSSAFMLSQDGIPAGVLEDFSIGRDGIITGIFNNGLTRSLGQIYLARFANPNGLSQLGSSMFQQAANSGEAVVSRPGVVGLGSIISGALEASNVDFAQEFTDLIVSQRAFQASARVITTADDLLEELVNIV